MATLYGLPMKSRVSSEFSVGAKRTQLLKPEALAAHVQADQTVKIVSGLFGLLWFIYAGGWAVLLPTSLDFTTHDDWAQHHLAWASFRQAPWSFPLGFLPDVGRPLGTYLAYMDGNPLWSSLCKVLLTPFEPFLKGHELQFIGAYMASCFVMQGYMAARLVGLISSHRGTVLLGAALLVMAPPLVSRIGHDTLCGHWLLLVALELMLTAGKVPLAKSCRLGFLALCVACGTHPYLLAMLFPSLVASVVLAKTGRERWRPREQFTVLVAMAATTLFALWGFGFVGHGAQAASDDFGIFSANLNTLVNAEGWSRFIGDFPKRRLQYEGFGYLGMGGIAAVLVGFLFLRGRPHVDDARRLGVIWTWAWVAFVFAVSPVAVLGTRELYHLTSLPSWVYSLGDIFRSSGRFVWPLVYTLLTLSVLRIVRTRPAKQAVSILLALCLLQVADLKMTRASRQFLAPRGHALSHPAWTALGPPYRQLTLVPPLFAPSQPTCIGRSVPQTKQVLPFVKLAVEHHMSINSAYVSRFQHEKMAAACLALVNQLAAGHVERDAVYIVFDFMLPYLGQAREQLFCAKLEGLRACIHKENRDAFRTKIAALHEHLPSP